MVYDLKWIAEQLTPPTGHETWVVENIGRLESSVSFLTASCQTGSSPIINLGRCLHRSESLVNGAAHGLLEMITRIADQRKQSLVTRIQTTANSQQILYENAGFLCVGFQPLKHQGQNHAGTLFYMRPDQGWVRSNPRTVISQSLPEMAELGGLVLSRLELPAPEIIADDSTGYSLDTDFSISISTSVAYEQAHAAAQVSNPATEISGPFNWGHGQLRIQSSQPSRAVLCLNQSHTVGGILFRMDDLDRCARIMDGFCIDSNSMGALLARTAKLAEEQLGALYTEMDVLASASQLLKAAEHLGFVPVAYLPGFGWRKDARVDVVKLVKLNTPYSPEECDLTARAREVRDTVDRSFNNQGLNLAILKLLRPLAMFAGLGDGEMRTISRLFSQRLFRAGEPVFAKGDTGKEAYIVLRGQINILLETGDAPVAVLSNGKIFGELAFLDGGPRSTHAIAAQPSILLVIQQAAFLDLARREPALGMRVMRNIAMDLASKLRNMDAAIAPHKSGV